jgi:hypothetical protein
VIVEGKQVLTNECSCMCSFGGKVSIINPGQMVLRLNS